MMGVYSELTILLRSTKEHCLQRPCFHNPWNMLSRAILMAVGLAVTAHVRTVKFCRQKSSDVEFIRTEYSMHY